MSFFGVRYPLSAVFEENQKDNCHFGPLKRDTPIWSWVLSKSPETGHQLPEVQIQVSDNHPLCERASFLFPWHPPSENQKKHIPRLRTAFREPSETAGSSSGDWPMSSSSASRLVSSERLRANMPSLPIEWIGSRSKNGLFPMFTLSPANNHGVKLLTLFFPRCHGT